MFRVVTSQFDQNRAWITERGPWHQSREYAEFWCDTLCKVGYNARIESQHGADHGGGAANDNADLLNALSSMA